MSATQALHLPHASAHAGHDAFKRVTVGYGFWIFLISDIIMFAAFFATYAVLTDSTAGGPSGKDLFDVRNVASSVCITCIEGEVRVHLDGQIEAIGAGRQYSYGERGPGQADNVDPAAATSWQDGFIVFRATPLSAAVAEINRYRPGKVILINALLGSKTVSGRFRIERIDEVLGWIERVTGARSRALPAGVVLLS